jgi:hypothetical protein
MDLAQFDFQPDADCDSDGFVIKAIEDRKRKWARHMEPASTVGCDRSEQYGSFQWSCLRVKE